MSSQQAVALRIRPRSGRDAVVGEMEGAIEIRLRAAPVDGAANTALCRFLADRLGVPSGAVTIVRGHRSRHKAITVNGLDAAAVRRGLLGRG